MFHHQEDTVAYNLWTAVLHKETIVKPQLERYSIKIDLILFDKTYPFQHLKPAIHPNNKTKIGMGEIYNRIAMMDKSLGYFSTSTFILNSNLLQKKFPQKTVF